MKSFSSGGITRRMAWGRTTNRSAFHRDRPSDRAAAVWDSWIDSMPARYTSATYAEYTSTRETIP